MSEATIAKNYAKALFEVAQKDNQQEKVLKELNEFANFMQKHADFSAVMKSKYIESAIKSAIIEKCSLKLSAVVAKMFKVLADANTFFLIGNIIKQYKVIYNKEAGIIAVKFTSVIKIAANMMEKIENRLSSLLNSKIDITYAVDTTIVGGFQVLIDDQLFDNSVKNQLLKMRRQIFN